MPLLHRGPADGLTVAGTTTSDVVWVRVRRAPGGRLEPAITGGQVVWLRPADPLIEDMRRDWVAYTLRPDGSWRYRPWPRPPVAHPRRSR